MNPENTPEALTGAVQLWPVVELDELVVFHPGDEDEDEDEDEDGKVV